MLTFFAVFGFVFLLLLFLTADYHFDSIVFFGFAGLGLAHLTLFFRICIAAAYQMAEERKSGALELLLSTPISVAEIIRGRRRALFRQFFGAALVIALLHIFFAIGIGYQLLTTTLPGYLQSAVEFKLDDEELLFSALILSGVILAVNWNSASWLGLWLGLRCKSSASAVWITFSIILLAPWIFFILLMALTVMLEFYRFTNSNTILSAFLFLGAVMGLGHAGFLIAISRRKLLARFRNYSADRFLAYRSLFPWPKLFRTACIFGACCIVMAGIAAIWRARVNARGKAAWERALAAHPEFLRERPASPPPPKISATENLAEAPLFLQLQPRARRRGLYQYSQTNLNHLLNLGYNANRQNDNPGDTFSRGELVSLEHHENNILRSFRGERRPISARTILDAFTSAEPLLKDLFDEARKRPYTYFQTANSRLIGLASALSLHAIVRLRLNESPTEEITLILRLAEGSRDADKSLAANLVQFAFQPAFEGLAQHRWNDQQLLDLQEAFSRVDPWQFRYTSLEQTIQRAVDSMHLNPRGPEPPILRAFYYLAPQGLSDERKAKMLNLSYEYLPGIFDPQTRRLSLAKISALQTLPDKGIEREFKLLGVGFVNDLRRAILIQTTCAQIQTACALERYRLKNNRYPQNLSDVGPIPEDPITGGPQTYRVSTDATAYVLYSVGWDGRDNGGAPPTPSCAETRACPSDWVWFSDPAAAKKLLNETASSPLQ